MLSSKQAQKQRDLSAVPFASSSSPQPPLPPPLPSLPFLQSPASIPPRRSSTGQHEKQQQQLAQLSLLQQSRNSYAYGQSSSHSHSHSHSHSKSHSQHRHSSSSSSHMSAGTTSSRSPTLRPVPETDWVRASSSSLSTDAAATGKAAALAVAAAAASASASGSASASTSTITPATLASTRRSRKPLVTMASLAAAAAAPPAADDYDDEEVVPGSGTTTPADGGAASSSSSSSSGGGLSGSSSSQGVSRPSAPDPMRYAAADLDFGARRGTWTREKERVIRGPYTYLNGVRGKEFRTQLINAFNGWLDVPAESLAVITRVVGMLHTASLLVDDVEDSSSLRRGMPVAHNIFGVPQSINSANYMYFVALQEVQKLRSARQTRGALAIFAEELVHLHRGQGMDLYWRDTLTCPTEDDYLEMVANKTGGLFRLGIKLMQAESRSLVDCVPLVNMLGLLFQIQDDYRNLMAADYTHNKGLCEDLSEGKFSFPVIHSIRSDPNDLQLLNILRLKTTDDEVKRYAVARMEATGSFAYTRQVLAVLTERARAMADTLDEGKGRSRAIHDILDKLSIK